MSTLEKKVHQQFQEGTFVLNAKAGIFLWMNGLTTAISDFILTVSTLKCTSRQQDREVAERELQTAPVNPPATGIVQVKIKIGMNSWGNESLSLWVSVSALNHLFTNIWSTLVFSSIKSVYYRNAIGPGVLTTLDALCSGGHPTVTITHLSGSGDRPRYNISEVNWKYESRTGLTLPCFILKHGPPKLW